MRLGKEDPIATAAATTGGSADTETWSHNILSLLYWLARRPIWWESGTQAEELIFFQEKRSCPKWESSCFSAVFLGALCVYQDPLNLKTRKATGKQPEDSVQRCFFKGERERETFFQHDDTRFTTTPKGWAWSCPVITGYMILLYYCKHPKFTCFAHSSSHSNDYCVH